MNNKKKTKILIVSLILSVLPFLVINYLERTRGLAPSSMSGTILRPFDPYLDIEMIRILKARQEK